MNEQIPERHFAARHKEGLRKLEFRAVETDAPGLIMQAKYRNKQGQTFAVTATADDKHREALRDFTDNLFGRFEAEPDDGTFAKLLEEAPLTKGSRPDDERRGITIDMTLVKQRKTGSMICRFHLDPRITPAGSPHRWKPDGDAVRAEIYVRRGKARLRMYSGTNPTDRQDQASAGHSAGPLGAHITKPRAHVRALADEAVYDFEGRWEQI